MTEHARAAQPVPEQPAALQPAPARKPVYRRVWFWIVMAVLALPALAYGALILWFAVAEDPLGGGPEVIDCAEATRAAGLETLPVSTGATCTAGGFQDPFVTIDLVAPQADVDAWLRSELPGTEPEQELCGDADECVRIGHDEPNAPGDGWFLNIDMIRHDDGTVAVAVMAFMT